MRSKKSRLKKILSLGLATFVLVASLGKIALVMASDSLRKTVKTHTLNG
jgi:hypothetical protein